MIARALIVVSLTTAFAGLPGGTPCTAAAQAATAGVIVEYDELHADEFCVPLERGARAIDALVATGLDLTLDDLGGERIAVCRIGGVGCDRDDCFCACRSTAKGCTFWGVYTLERQTWAFAEVGVGELRVESGDVIGLRWAEQTPSGGAAPVTGAPQGVCVRAAARSGDPVRDQGPGLGVLAVVALVAALAGAALWTRRTR